MFAQWSINFKDISTYNTHLDSPVRTAEPHSWIDGNILYEEENLHSAFVALHKCFIKAVLEDFCNSEPT